MNAEIKFTEASVPKTFDNGKTIYKFKAIMGGHDKPSNFETWEKEIIDSFEIDGVYEIEYDEKVNGEFTNRMVKKLKVGDEWIPKKKATGRQPYAETPEKRESIERMNALTNAVSTYQNVEVKSINEILSTAETFYQWLSKGTMPEAPQCEKTPINEPEPIKTSIPMKDWNDFATAFKNLGLNWAGVYKLLKVKNTTEMQETYKSPAATYATLLTRKSEAEA